MDATRKRRSKDPARQRYYPKHRQQRFARLGEKHHDPHPPQHRESVQDLWP